MLCVCVCMCVINIYIKLSPLSVAKSKNIVFLSFFRPIVVDSG